MERYPLSTHSREVEITSVVFGVIVIGMSYLLTLEQGFIISILHSAKDRVGWVGAATSEAPNLSHLPPTMQSPGPWRAEGSRLIDESGAQIRLKGINWSGCETANKIPGGLDRQDYRAILDAMKKAGFNVVRLPLSNSMVENPIVSTDIAFQINGVSVNEDLRQLNSLEILDKVIAYSGSIGLRVILDNHRSTVGGGPQENGLWFTEEFPETSWLDDWRVLARRYRKQYTVIGFDLRDEAHSIGHAAGAGWGCGRERDWHLAAERAGNLILSEDPSKLIIIEGVDVYENDASWWGGNLEGVKRHPVQLSIPDHIIYSAHEYGPMEHSQPWFNASTTSASLQALWNRRWGFIEDQGIAPVFIGEFGTSLTDQHSDTTPGSQGQWFGAFINYLQTRSHVGWSYWSANAEDRYAFFKPDYVSEHADSNQLRHLLTHENLFSRSGSALATSPKQEPSLEEICQTNGVDGQGAATCPAGNHSAQRKHVDEGLQSYISENIGRATRSAIRTLPSE